MGKMVGTIYINWKMPDTGIVFKASRHYRCRLNNLSLPSKQFTQHAPTVFADFIRST